MKTPIVYLEGKWYRRAHRPSAEAAADRSGPVVAKFRPSYVEPAGKRGYINFATGKVTERREPARRIPDRVQIGHHRFFFERGVCKHVRLISAEAQMALNALDEQIAQLETERRDLCEDAYARGQHLRVDDIREGTVAYDNETARIRAGKE